MFRILSAVAAIALGATAVLAQLDVNAARKDFMEKYGKFGYNTLNRMARAQMPYEQAKVDEALAHFAETAPKMPSLFPVGGFKGPVPDSNYYSAAKAFEAQNQADMKARAEKFAKDAADAKGKVKDLAGLKAVWPAINDNHCGSCHEVYRLRRS